MLLSKTSAWPEEGLVSYLETTVIPMRLAATGSEFPSITSLWFAFDAERELLLCASHQGSQLVKLLGSNNRVAFEIAHNEPPYKGVRGRGEVTLTRTGVDETLNKLIHRYLGDTNDSLAKWLLSRTEEEFVLEIKPVWMTSWDYGHRMEPAIS